MKYIIIIIIQLVLNHYSDPLPPVEKIVTKKQIERTLDESIKKAQSDYLYRSDLLHSPINRLDNLYAYNYNADGIAVQVCEDTLIEIKENK